MPSEKPELKVGQHADDGGQAFPRPMVNGMTIRDYFAAQALNVLVAQVPLNDPHSWAARNAYSYADAMIAARKQADNA